MVCAGTGGAEFRARRGGDRAFGERAGQPVGEPVGAAAWLSVILAVGAGVWCAWTGREVLRRREPAIA